MNGTGGNDSWDGQTNIYDGTSGPKLTIKNATGTVNNNGTVHIADGVYSGENNTGITISQNMNIIGQSQYSTIINGLNTAQIFNITSGVNVTIHDLTIKNGNATVGGAVYTEGNLTLQKCTIINNTAEDGIIYNVDSTIIITNCIFTNNTANIHGTIISNGGDNYITNCTFTNNKADCGSAILFHSLGTCKITNCIFINNSATSGNGGAIYNDKSMTVTNCIFVNNTATGDGGAIYNKGLNFTATLNNFYGNSANYSNTTYNDGDANLEKNWWGSNNPNLYTNLLSGRININYWLYMTLTANPTIIKNSKVGLITASFNNLYDGNTVIPFVPSSGQCLPNGALVSFTTTFGTISTPVSTINGIAQSILRVSSLGVASVSAKFNSQILRTSVRVVDTLPPQVLSVYPKKSSKNISRSKTIVIAFNEKILRSSYWSKIYVKDSHGKKIKIIKTIINNKLYIKTSKRAKNTTYTVYVPTKAVKDTSANNLAKTLYYKFKTGNR